MRLWHKELINVLPRQQLVSQWRECCCIGRLIKENGTPNHILVNKIIEYSVPHFVSYTRLVSNEMKRRKYKVDDEKFLRYIESLYLPCYDCALTFESIFADWHNNRYFFQCFYNLQEKYDCGGISDEEWNQIDQKAIMLKYGTKKENDNYG